MSLLLKHLMLLKTIQSLFPLSNQHMFEIKITDALKDIISIVVMGTNLCVATVGYCMVAVLHLNTQMFLMFHFKLYIVGSSWINFNSPKLPCQVSCTTQGCI